MSAARQTDSTDNFFEGSDGSAASTSLRGCEPLITLLDSNNNVWTESSQSPKLQDDQNQRLEDDSILETSNDKFDGSDFQELKILLRRLHRRVTAHDLTELFKECGNFVDTGIHEYKKGGRHISGFVNVGDVPSADRAILKNKVHSQLSAGQVRVAEIDKWNKLFGKDMGDFARFVWRYLESIRKENPEETEAQHNQRFVRKVFETLDEHFETLRNSLRYVNNAATLTPKTKDTSRREAVFRCFCKLYEGFDHLICLKKALPDDMPDIPKELPKLQQKLARIRHWLVHMEEYLLTIEEYGQMFAFLKIDFDKLWKVYCTLKKAWNEKVLLVVQKEGTEAYEKEWPSLGSA